jgi:hypothetical protein
MSVSRINTPITSAIVAMGKVVGVASNENGDWLDIQTCAPRRPAALQSDYQGCAAN